MTASAHDHRHRITRTDVEAHTSTTGAVFRIFQVGAAIAGAILFGLGVVAALRVDYGAPLLDTSAAVAGYGFSAVGAIAAIVLGGAALAATLADQDRAGASFVGMITLVLGIVALAVDAQSTSPDVQVDHRSAGLFIVLGAVIFVLGLVPWFGRRRTTVVEERR